jgi:SecD/SecF fusion protein
MVANIPECGTIDRPELAPARRPHTRSGLRRAERRGTNNATVLGSQTTKEIAHRGQEAQLPGVTKASAEQHFAVALDGQLITAPSIDYTKFPEGIDASQGSEISGGFTPQTSKELAEEITAGTLPVRIELRREDLITTFR